MLKRVEVLKEAEFYQQVPGLLRHLLARVPSLKVKTLRPEVEASSGRHDWLAKLVVGGRPWTLLIESKRFGQPREVRGALSQLQHALTQSAAKSCYAMVVAPFLSPESTQLCNEAGVGYADLAGNARLSFDQVFIELQAAGNPFRVQRHLRSLFTPKASRLLRVLLTPPLRAWKVTELQGAAGISLGQVSNVRKLLLDHEWAVASDAGLLLNKPEELARAWQRSYKPHLRAKEGAYTLLHDKTLADATRAALAEAGNGEHAVLASYSAARWIAPYARQATEFLYADKRGADILKRHLQLKPVSRGENVVLLEPREDDVFSRRIEAAPGIWCSGLVQTWLDLGAAGERGTEAADQLLEARLLPEWRQVSP